MKIRNTSELKGVFFKCRKKLALFLMKKGGFKPVNEDGKYFYFSKSMNLESFIIDMTPIQKIVYKKYLKEGESG